MDTATIITIDRTQPFDPVNFLGKGWSIEEQDERSLVLAKIDIAKVFLATAQGDENLRRRKEAGHIRLDAKVFQTLWENQTKIPESWKSETNGSATWICFNGTVFRGPGGERCVLSLFWSAGWWHWGRSVFVGGWLAFYPSAVLASI